MQTNGFTDTVAALLIYINWKTSYCLFSETAEKEMFTYVSVWIIWKHAGGQYDMCSTSLTRDLLWDVQTLPVQWPNHMHHRWLPYDIGNIFYCRKLAVA